MDKVSLDFSELFTEEKQAPRKPTDAFKTGNTTNISSESQNATERLTEGLARVSAFKLEKRAKKDQDERAEALRICREHQENTAKSQHLQSEILKGLTAGEDIYSLFLKAAKIISVTTANSLFYTQAEKDIIAVYGIGLQEKAPLSIELEQVQRRLDKLTEAVGREQDPDGRERIKRAITAHRARAGELARMIEKA